MPIEKDADIQAFEAWYLKEWGRVPSELRFCKLHDELEYREHIDQAMFMGWNAGIKNRDSRSVEAVG